MTRRVPGTLTAAAAAATLLTCGEDRRSPVDDAPAFAVIAEPAVVERPLTWHADVRPVVDGRCASCHGATEAQAGIALDTYASAFAARAQLRDAVAARRMPPWLTTRACNEYRHDLSLTEDERALVTSWVDQGAPEGDAAQAAPLGDRVGTTLSRVDLTLAMPEAYTPQGTDDYRCFLLDWPGTAPSFVTGFGVTPGNRGIVHHVIAFLVPPDLAPQAAALDAAEAGPGYTCFGGPVAGARTGAGASILGAWVPGMDGGDYPAGTGILVQPGAKIALQVHYHTGSHLALHPGHAPAGEDKTSLRLKIDALVDKPAAFIPVANPAWVSDPARMRIPAGGRGVVHSFRFDPTILAGDRPITVHMATLHQHRLGTRSRLSIVRAAGADSECLVDIPRWDFNWQLLYELQTPVTIAPGEQVRVDCEWTNPGGAAVGWGEGTDEEMCLGALYATW